jgi:glycopeptide antibiotics resistance protein
MDYAARVSLFIGVVTVLFFVLVWLGLVAFLRKRGKGTVYLLFFSVFFVYICKVVDYTLLQFQFLLWQLLMPGQLMLRGYSAMERVNVVPLLTLTAYDLRTSLLNILLFVPFGFGLPFITAFRMKRTVLIAATFSIAIELLQLLSGLLADAAFRIVDINDVIFNTVGAVIGYALFVVFVRAFRRVTRGRKIASHAIPRHIAERPQVVR